jgi:HEAT repeat protein
MSRLILTAVFTAAPLLLTACAGHGLPADQPPPIDAREVAELREQAIAALLEFGADQAPELRANAIEALARGAPGRVGPLIEKGLADDNQGVRAVAAMVAARIRHESSTLRLRELLDDESAWVQMAAIYALWQLGEQLDPTPMASALLSGPPRQRAQAAFLLGEMGEPSALKLLAAAAGRTIPLASPNEVRMFELQVDQARVKLGQPQYIQSIRAALYPSRSEELELTVLAVQLIGELGDRGAAGELINLTARVDEEGNPMPAEVQIAAAQALARLGNPRGAFIIREHLASDSAPIRAQAALALGELDDPANLGAIRRLMDDPSSLVRVHAAAAAARLTRGGAEPQGGRTGETGSAAVS